MSLFDIRQFDARGDGRKQDAPAVQQSIDACSDAGGGTVFFPPGKYLCGPLTLRSHTRLYLEAGARLLGSTEPSDYEGTDPVLLSGREIEAVSIEGHGRIDGQTTADLGRRPGRALETRPRFRTRLVKFEDCDDLTIRDISLVNCDAWTVHFRRCRDVVVDGVRISNNYYRTNTDGINPDSCQRVHISNCEIRAGDDGICLKTCQEQTCEDVVVTNCTIESIATAIKIGTESRADFRNIMVTNCTIRNSCVGLGIYVKDGATVERVSFSNIALETLRDPSLVNAPRLGRAIYPVFFDVEKRTEDSRLGRIRDVTVRDLQILSDNGVLVQGTRESPIENLSFENLTIRINRGFSYSERVKHAGGRANPNDDRITLYARKPSYMTIAHTRGLSIGGLRVIVEKEAFRTYGRSALSLHDVQDVTMGDIRRDPPGSEDSQPVVQIEDCRRALISHCPSGARAYLGVAGPKTSEIRIVASDLSPESVLTEGLERSVVKFLGDPEIKE